MNVGETIREKMHAGGELIRENPVCDASHAPKVRLFRSGMRQKRGLGGGRAPFSVALGGDGELFQDQ